MLPKKVLSSLPAYVAALAIGCSPLLFAADASSVKIWEEQITIPTYLAGAPEPNPMFFFGRESQGAQGPVYPYPMYDTLTGKKVDKTYAAVYLENEYLRIGVLPEIGGRIFVSESTAKFHVRNVMRKLHVHSRAEVAYAAGKRGLLDQQ